MEIEDVYFGARIPRPLKICVQFYIICMSMNLFKTLILVISVLEKCQAITCSYLLNPVGEYNHLLLQDILLQQLINARENLNCIVQKFILSSLSRNFPNNVVLFYKTQYRLNYYLFFILDSQLADCVFSSEEKNVQPVLQSFLLFLQLSNVSSYHLKKKQICRILPNLNVSYKK